ncbi:MAG: restriction endonuclease [Planctomycetes bacterium]|nr:restriction endonuclease [Planctomycetota bacterium]
MPVPDFQSFLLPVLQAASDGEVHSLAETRERIATQFGLTPEDRAELLPSGRQARFDNRVAWAKSYLQQAALITSPRRAHFAITPRGKELLATKPERLTIEILEQYPEFKTFRDGSGDSSGAGAGASEPAKATETPEEVLELAYSRIRADLAADVLNRVKQAPPTFFESLVVDLLLKMGYGRNRAEAGRAIGASGDEGIDGIISEDRLGLDVIYVQAKRWDNTVGRPDIQKFVGALSGKRARKGVFITTSAFSAEAVDYVTRIDPRVVLIDGKQLAEYMIDHNLGVSTKSTFELKRVDTDFFSEE